MEQNIDRKVKEIIRLSLGNTEFRVSLVITLLKEGMYEQALSHSLPLIATKHSPWFLYARAWHYLAEGDIQDAYRVLGEAYGSLDSSSQEWPVRGFSFTEQGLPKMQAPFNCPFAYSDPAGFPPPDDTDLLGFATAIFREDWMELLADIGRNIREYKLLFRSLAASIEKILHHDADTVGAAVAATEFEDGLNRSGSSFLLLSLMSSKHLRLVSETLWRVSADWNFPLYLCEVSSYFYYLLEEEDMALDLANAGLKKNPASLICGNVRALVLNRMGKPYCADEQWRETLALWPDRSATYLVLGHQSLCSGGLDAALRYFQEAVVIGDNLPEANRFLTAALECV